MTDTEREAEIRQARDIWARIEFEPIPDGGGSRMEMATIWFGDIPVRCVPVGPESKQRQVAFVERVNARINARVSELLAANTAEVERRRAAEAERDAALALFRNRPEC